jgi:hypothetical protein
MQAKKNRSEKSGFFMGATGLSILRSEASPKTPHSHKIIGTFRARVNVRKYPALRVSKRLTVLAG